MTGAIHRLLAADHRRLETLLARATADPDETDRGAFAEFRAGLLRHIGLEEKILLPAVQRLRGGEPLPVAAVLRLQHGAIAALLVPTPTPDVIATLRVVLSAHNPLEEGPGGAYEICDDAAGEDEIAPLLAKLEAAAKVAVARHVDGPNVLGAARRALTRAGFDPETLPLTRQARTSTT